MFIELHILQNFAPSNLNRDDTGAPKDCEFGGYRRARISSQCLKRAVRQTFKHDQLLPEAHLGRMAVRTKRLVDEELVPRLAARGRDEKAARIVAEAALASVKLRYGSDEKHQAEHLTQYLLFLGESEIEAIAKLCDTQWDLLLAAAGTEDPAPLEGRGRRAAKKAASAKLPPEIEKAMKALLNGGEAADLALFGRMLADLPERNVDAACQVAHAISTNRVSMEMDFYTAVDDLKPEDTAGADMLGTVEFNSACFYRYANVDLETLRANLLAKDLKDGTVAELSDAERLARQTLEAFLHASVQAVPTGKQNSMAAQNPPSLVLAVARERGLWNLANAFVQPVRPTQQCDLVQGSIERLDSYWGRLTTMYGENGLVGSWVCLLDGGTLRHLGTPVPNVGELVTNVLAAVSFDQPAGNGQR